MSAKEQYPLIWEFGQKGYFKAKDFSAIHREIKDALEWIDILQDVNTSREFAAMTVAKDLPTGDLRECFCKGDIPYAGCPIHGEFGNSTNKETQ